MIYVGCCSCCCCFHGPLCSHIDFVFSLRRQNWTVRLTSPHATMSKSSRSRGTTASKSWWASILAVSDCLLPLITFSKNETYCLGWSPRPINSLGHRAGQLEGVTFSHFSSWDGSLFVVTDVTWPVNPLQGLTSLPSKCATAVASRACFSQTMCPSCWTMCLLDLSVHVC